MTQTSRAYQIGYDAAASQQYFDKLDARSRALKGLDQMGIGAAFDNGWDKRRAEMKVSSKAIRGTW